MALVKYPGLFLLLFSIVSIYAQQENVPLDNRVYLFLKEMKVKGIVNQIHEDSPNMSRFEVKKHLEIISQSSALLSSTEKELLKKFEYEFYDDQADSTNSAQIFGSNSNFSGDVSDIVSNKLKYAFVYREDKTNFYTEILGRILHGQALKPIVNNSELYDIAVRVHGTLFDKLGYGMTIQKGGVNGSQDLAPTFDPRLNYNFKFVEKLENIGNYDFTEGYLRYYSEPIEKMGLAFQIGREKISLGYGYGGKLTLSGQHPYLDFIRMNFNYGIFSFTSMAASTVGEFDFVKENNYTKYFAYNKFKFSFKNFADLGIGEAIVYSGRGLDFAYLNPFAFYKFEEMSLQDRDNGVVFLDFQTNFMKNLELQGTFFLDENILSHLQEMNLFSNKTAYQLGLFYYEPLGFRDMSLVLEYTKIRPYVYSHTNPQNSYTAWSQTFGHYIGPNSDEIYARISLNFNSWIRGNFEFQRIRSAENIYDGLGNLIFNAGGDFLVPFRDSIDPKYIDFLEGDKFNSNIFTLSFSFEPIREVYFDLMYKYMETYDVSRDKTNINSNASIKMIFEF